MMEPKICSRCGKLLSQGWTVSYFNTDVICLECKDEEKTFPEYRHAVTTEKREIVENKNYSYEGIGLPNKYARMYERRRAGR